MNDELTERVLRLRTFLTDYLYAHRSGKQFHIEYRDDDNPMDWEVKSRTNLFSLASEYRVAYDLPQPLKKWCIVRNNGSIVRSMDDEQFAEDWIAKYGDRRDHRVVHMREVRDEQ